MPPDFVRLIKGEIVGPGGAQVQPLSPFLPSSWADSVPALCVECG